MAKFIIRVNDDAADFFNQLMSHLAIAEVVGFDYDDDTQEVRDRCVLHALCELRENYVFCKKSDYAYIMQAANEGVLKELPIFDTPQKYLNYLKALGWSDLPGLTTIYDARTPLSGKYPDWSFSDTDDETEALRRKNVVVQFRSAYFRARREMSETISDNASIFGSFSGKVKNG